MDKLIHLARTTIVTVLYHLGILSLCVRMMFRRRAVVLMYHRVLTPEACASTWSHPRIIVTRATFDRHLELLGRLFKLVTLEEYIRRVEANEPFDRPSCLITFDDGWLDTYTEAWPLLRKHDAPAVVFLPSDYIGTGLVFWQERTASSLSAIRARAEADKTFADRARRVLSPHGLAAALDVPASDARDAIADLVRTHKTGSRTEIDAMAQAIADLAGPRSQDDGIDRFMDWNHVAEMARDGIAFGGHGARHFLLTSLTGAEATEDVQECWRALSARLPADRLTFSYPNGNWNREVSDAVRQAGFRMAFATMRVKESRDRFAVRRLNIYESAAGSSPRLLGRILGWV
jgi:peptidoglycan/xylan/chitin deacetylase (PgdA/CDA1 family)